MNTCGECAFICYNHSYDDSKEKFWCDNTWKHIWVSPNQYACSEFCTRYYLTSFTTELIGKGKQNEYVAAIKTLRKKLEQDPSNNMMLDMYDLYAPMIVCDMVMTYNPKQIALNIFNLCVEPVVSLLKEGKEEEALLRYKAMVKLFIDDMKYTNSKRKEITKEKKFEYKNPFIINVK